MWVTPEPDRVAPASHAVAQWLPVTPTARPGLTPLGAYIRQRRDELGIPSEVKLVELINRLKGEDGGVSRAVLQNWSRDPAVAPQPSKLRAVARALAGDFSEASYERELNALLQLVGRPTVESDELDVDPELIRQLGAAGRKFIQAQIEAVVQLRRDIWAERSGPADDDHADDSAAEG